MTRSTAGWAGMGVLAASVLLGGCRPPLPTIEQCNAKASKAYAAGQYTDAIGAWQVALDQNPQQYQAHYGIGIANLALAEQAFREQQNPPLALLNLDKAEYHLKACIEAHPGDTFAQQALATLYRRRGEYRSAVGVVTFGAQDSWPQARRYVVMGKELEKQGDMDQARTAYHQAIAVEPDKPDGYQALAELYRRLGDTAKAEQYQADADQRQAPPKKK